MSAALKSIFENQPKTISPEKAAELIGVKRSTIYDMHHRPWNYDIKSPEALFFKNGRLLRIVTDKLEEWLISRSGGKS